jgi:hypothetical protein
MSDAVTHSTALHCTALQILNTSATSHCLIKCFHLLSHALALICDSFNLAWSSTKSPLLIISGGNDRPRTLSSAADRPTLFFVVDRPEKVKSAIFFCIIITYCAACSAVSESNTPSAEDLLRTSAALVTSHSQSSSSYRASWYDSSIPLA